MSALNSPLVIGGSGGSGTRLIATMLRSCGLYLGADLNPENDNLWFTLLFKRPPAFLPILKNQRESSDLTQAITIFARAMQGQSLTVAERAYVDRAYREILNAPREARWGLPSDLLEKARYGLYNLSPVDMTAYRGWGWKEPNSHLFVPYLSQHFPELKVIHVIRHPLDMAYSDNQNQLYNWGSLFNISPPRTTQDIQQASLDYYLRANQAAIAWGEAHLGSRFLVVNFDQLCTSPEAECARLIEFIGVTDLAVADLTRLVQPPDSIGRYRNYSLSAFSRESLAEVQALGFAVESTAEPAIGESSLMAPSPTGSDLADLFKKIDRHRALIQKHELEHRQPPTSGAIIEKPLGLLKRVRDLPAVLRRQTILNKLVLQEIEAMSLLLQSIPQAVDHAGSVPLESDTKATYRSFVGPADKYDLVAANQFNLMTTLGLREDHFLLDIGCGSLRGGRLFIPYLLAGHYFGIDPNQWLIREGIAHELGADMVRIKRPTFDFNGDFKLTVFDRPFDYLVAQSIFSHAAPEQISVCLAEAQRVMQPTSIFAATFRQGATNYQGSEWVYPDGIDYTLTFIVSLAAKAGLDCTPIDWPHPNGQTWIKLTLAQ